MPGSMRRSRRPTPRSHLLQLSNRGHAAREGRGTACARARPGTRDCPCHARQRAPAVRLGLVGRRSEYRRALEINPNLPEANLGYATYLATLGRFDEAIARVTQAYRFDPLALESRNEALWIYYFSGRMRETVEQCEKTIDVEPAAGLPYAMLALANAHLGQRADAIRAAETAVRLSNSPTILTTAASALARAGQRAEARQLLGRALGLAKERYVCRFIVAAAVRGSRRHRAGARLARAGVPSALDLNTLDRGGSPNDSASQRSAVRGSRAPRRDSALT